MVALPVETVDPNLRQNFLAGMSNAACTVNVVTTHGPSGRFGVTVSAMASVSADTSKPTLLVCIHHQSAAAKAIIENGVFCVNVLRDDQSAISDCFAGRWKTQDGDKFSCTAWVKDLNGSPRVVDPLVAFSCRIVSTQRMGTHHVVFGAVEDIFVAEGGSPLIYANRAYGTPSRIDAAKTSAATSERHLRLGVFHTFGPYVVPKVLDRLSAQGKAIDLTLIEGDQKRILESLRAGDIDLALAYDLDIGGDTKAERLAELQPYVLLAEGHPLAAHASLSLADLADAPLILLDAPPSGAYFLSLFKDRNLTPDIRFRSNSFEMVRGLVGRGFGYSILATKPASNMSYDGRALTTRPLSEEVAPSHLALLERAGTGTSEAAGIFAAACRDIFRTM